ncbi:MerR family transcriptional regulator [Paenibacillus provencensis]|uniref:MerR family transcriptional regulator n=1 Tax=Paenibacillus provencensis TaxID=441151 RepID=A0ABW3PRK0_9BACL|nr:MerR family transcriptional regulator [Paenibacillus sp. MER 78]MCM3129515.1 MerR family transcriptional regulator [Paenibacillus sp. MER 78]
MNYLSTGMVSKKLNVSLRTLRYYDQIELVQPSYKDENGKRHYTPENLLLLEKVLLLKSASMSLEDIKKLINQLSIEKTLHVHRDQLKYDIERLQQALDYTNTLMNMTKLQTEIKWDLLLPLLSNEQEAEERKRRKKQVMEEWFTADEQTILTDQLPKMENDPVHMTKWINLIKRIEICLEENKYPSSRDAQIIAEDTLLLSDEMFQGNKELADKFWEARRSEEASSDLNLYPIKEEMIIFMEQAIIYYETKNFI